MRIVSLLPSATEILFDLGLGDQVVGVTFECDFPAQAKSKRVVSTSALPENLTPSEIDAVVKERMAAGEDLYRLDRGAFADLDPDLVVTQDLCAVCAVDVSEVEDALEFLACSAAVVTLDPMSLDEVIDSIGMVAAVTGTEPLALELQDELRQRLRRVGEDVKKLPRPKVLVLEWADPAFTAGHWVPDLGRVSRRRVASGAAQARTLLGSNGAKSARAAADIVVVSPCGFRLDGAAEQAEHVIAQGHLPPKAQVWAIDADAFMVRPGPRVVEGVEILASIFHSEARGPVDPVKARRIA